MVLGKALGASGELMMLRQHRLLEEVAQFVAPHGRRTADSKNNKWIAC